MAPSLPRPHVEPVLSMAFQELAYVVHLPDRTDAVVIDPGLEPGHILTYLDGHQLQLAAVVLTHAHGDHTAGTGSLLERFPESDVVAGRLEAPGLSDPAINLSAMFGFQLAIPEPTRLLDDGDRIELAGMPFDVLLVPGHTAGHIALVYPGDPALLFDGDILFAGGIGRFDFPGGDYDQLIAGIRDKLLALPDETILYPGHGPRTTIGQERATNPFLKGT